MSDKFEAGYKEKFTIVSSADFDAAPTLNIFNSDGTGVNSMTSVSSASNAYYAFMTMSNTKGFYSYEWIYGQASQGQVKRGIFEIVETLATESNLYCNANDIRNLYEPINKSDLRNEEIDGFIRDVMNEVNTKLSGRYSVPFAISVNSLPPVISTITKNLTLSKVVKRKGGANIPEWIKDEEEKYNTMLDDLGEGNIFLTLSGGNIIAPSIPSEIGKVDHSMEDYVPTFNMLNVEDQRIDPDRREDEEDSL